MEGKMYTILRRLKLIAQIVGLLGFMGLAIQGMISLLSGQAAWAAPLAQWGGSTVPLVVNYQGYLRDAEGAPFTGSYTITFKIYADVITATALYQETQPGVTVRNGYFSVLLGNNNPPDNSLPQDLFNSPERFIGVTVAPYAEMIPRQRFAAVPYAFQALQAQSLRPPDGSPAYAAYADNNGNVGIGTQEPKAGLEIYKGATNDLALLLHGTGGGWGSGMQFKNAKTYGIYTDQTGSWRFADSDNGVDRMVINKDGNVGIGIGYFDSPQAKLHVNGDMKISGQLLVDSKPIKFYRFDVPPNDQNVDLGGHGPLGPDFDTHISKNDYVCGQVGWAVEGADIYKNAHEYVETFSTGQETWWIRTNFLHRGVKVTLICVDTDLASWGGPLGPD
jgi:hypothetical protein